MNATAPINKLVVVGVGLLCFTLSFLASTVWPLWQQQQRLNEQLQILSAQKQELQGNAKNETDLPTNTDERKSNPPPKLADATNRLRDLLNVANDLGLNTDNASYRIDRADEAQPALYHLTLPVRGTYPTLRKFIDAALDQGSYVTLDQLSLQRAHASEASVDGELVFTLRFVRQ